MTEKAGTNNNKDVVYIDVDDEITGIIEKVRGSHSKIVALVLPKRATVLQSIVNMKLLKRSADESKKNMVLITAEAGLLPLAGSVGIHVAKSLQSKPEIPDAPDRGDGKPEDVDEPGVDDEALQDEGEPVDKTLPVGELAGAAAMEDTIEMDDDDGEAEADVAGGVGTTGAGGILKPAKTKKDKKLKIPNFNRFRVLIMVACVALVGLIVLGYFCLVVLPKATIAIKTDSQALTSSTVINLKTAADTTLDAKGGIVPAKAQLVQKTVTQQAPATGSQNNGAKASGKVTLTIKDCSTDQATVPSGSGITSGGLVFITQEAATLYSVKVGGVCKNSSYPSLSSATVDVIAQKAGAAYNLASGSTYTVPGISTVSGSGSAMAGGTDDIIKIVMQADIDAATAKIAATDTAPIKEELKTDLVNASQYPIVETFSTATPDTKTSVNAGDTADAVTVTQTIKYTMFGVNKDDLKKVVAADVDTKIDPKKQSILNYGVDDAVFGVQGTPDGGATLTMQAQVVAGPDLHADDLKKQVAGKKAGDAQEIIKQNPGVKEVVVHYSPFWVSSIPSKTSKITITIEKPQATKSDSTPNAPSNP
ncbi:MAG TPA: hypothetical protein VGO07_06855 [Candidatus Saccharimonadales bacterium]|jgi:hypothetical protein|nr:hypothetical protein [Candidatus Saccharimonadales bacterium]